MGLSTGEIGRLAAEGAYSLMERKPMNDMTKDMLRSVLMGVGAVMVYMGWLDSASMQEWVGGMLSVASIAWAWFDHA